MLHQGVAQSLDKQVPPVQVLNTAQRKLKFEFCRVFRRPGPHRFQGGHLKRRAVFRAGKDVSMRGQRRLDIQQNGGGLDRLV